MSDLIRREDAINAMAELQGIAQSKAELTGISKAWKRIKALPTASPWHRCEDGLPEEEGRYFIAVFYKGKWLYNVAWFVKDIGDILGVPGSDGEGGFVSNSAEVYPDCWMMPIEPPKEDA